MNKIISFTAMIMIGCSGADPNPFPSLGPQGSPGKDGQNGKDGQSIQGPQGLPGKNGQNTNVSGSRIRAKNFLGADGSIRQSGWFDSKLGTDVDVYPGADGNLYFVPSNLPDIGSPNWFADANCSQALTQVQPGRYCYVLKFGKTNWFGSSSEPAVCYNGNVTVGYRYFELTLYNGSVYQSDNGSCYQVSDQGALWYAWGKEMISAIDFVQVSIQIE